MFKYLTLILWVMSWCSTVQCRALAETPSELDGRSYCGGIDEVDGARAGRVRRGAGAGAIEPPRWHKTNLTYSECASARRGPHVGLDFSPAPAAADHADISFAFFRGNHSDMRSFDGLGTTKGNILAHAFSPKQSGTDVHFDDDDSWVEELALNETNAYLFYNIALHEIGHALGLHHSNTTGAVMYPSYSEEVSSLHDSDILAIQTLYQNAWSEDKTKTNEVNETKTIEIESTTAGITGTEAIEIEAKTDKTTELDRTTDTVTNENDATVGTIKLDSRKHLKPVIGTDDTEDKPSLCNAGYDTLQVIQGNIYVFKGDLVWLMYDRNQPEAGYPRSLHDLFPGLPAHITSVQAIVEKPDGNVVIFSGRDFWVFTALSDWYEVPLFSLTGQGDLSMYSLPPDVRALSAVFHNHNKTHLIHGDQFWRYDERTNTTDEGYPKSMSAWKNIIYPINAAVVWRRETTFFRGPRFWRFNPRGSMVASPPQPVAQNWLNCTRNPEMRRYYTN